MGVIHSKRTRRVQMAFTTEALQELGLTQEQIKEVFALHGKTINPLKAELEESKGALESLNNQLTATGQQLEALKADASTSEETKKALENLQSDYNNYKAKAEAELAQTKKVSAITLALKDTNAYNPDKLMKFIDVDAIELDKDGKPQLSEIIDGLKESDPYLFKQEDDTPSPTILPPGNPQAGGSESDPFQAIIDGYGK